MIFPNRWRLSIKRRLQRIGARWWYRLYMHTQLLGKNSKEVQGGEFLPECLDCLKRLPTPKVGDLFDWMVELSVTVKSVGVLSLNEGNRLPLLKENFCWAVEKLTA